MQDIQGDEQERCSDESLQHMPPEIVSLICSHVRSLRDLVALAMAASHLVTEPLFVYVGRLASPDRLSRLIAAGAPLSAVEYLLDHWRMPLAVHLLGDAAAGGRLDVVRWLYGRLTGCDVEKHMGEDDSHSDDTRDGDNSGPDNGRSDRTVPLPTACGTRPAYPDRTRRTYAQHARRTRYTGSIYTCSDSDTSTCTDSDIDDYGNNSDGDHEIATARVERNLAGAARISPSPTTLRDAASTARAGPTVRRTLPIAHMCVKAAIRDVMMCAVRGGHANIVRWMLDLIREDDARQLTTQDFEHLEVEAASRGNVPVLAMLCQLRPMRSKNIALAALQADQMDVVDWIGTKRLLRVPKMTPTLVGDLIAEGHRPRFIRWAASHGHKANPTALVPLVERDNVDTLSLVHNAGVCACTPEIVRAAARAGSLGVLKWAAGDDHGTPRAGSAWRPTDVAMLAAINRRREVIAWLHTRSDGRRALTAGVARAALAAGCVDVAAQIRPLGTWDAVEAAVASCDPDVVRAVLDAGGVCSPAAFASALRHGNAHVLAFLCERGGIAFLESALASLAGVECAPTCIEWIANNPPTAHLCVAEAFAAILAKGEVYIEGTCRCAACADLLP
ncbi:hypothetical protein pmac_cds_608 [Pandoravirus macleodensis]|uniref:Ankyrin repeat domain containing protein n=1 Tax=Pandoravirus macleodensis TaxID=2107707 RepID=A0A2U7UFR2_9VIRU|nr:hypothetical protein pmac_cds_608 [Pandoravirus macleodensis]AVK77296.1 hypothetical protein pmac_cds_608 [Pandoravirus macleodensis]